jgi:hypothetical protein
MQPIGAQSRRSLAHGQHPSGHVQDVGSHQSGQVSGQEFNPGPGYGDGAWIFAVVTVAAIMLALLLGATVRQVPALRGGSDVVVPSQRS